MDSPSRLLQVRRSLGLPQELIDVILEFLWNDQEALQQCCLSSRSFRPLCQRYIFECVRMNPISGKRSEKEHTSDNPHQTPKIHVGDSHTPTMAQRLEDILKSSPGLALLIRDLRICNVDESDWESSFGWLEKDTSLPFILPHLVNLERFYLSGSLTDDSRVKMTSLPKPVQEALFTTWKSPKLTHIGIHCVIFATFHDLTSVLLHSIAVRDITLCFVDVDVDDLDGNDLNTAGVVAALNGDVIEGKSDVLAPSTIIRAPTIDSLALFAEPEVLSHLCSWLLSPTSNLPLSALRKLHLPVGLPDDLPFFHQILKASPSLEELHVTMLSWIESAPREPADISSLKVVRLAIDLGEDDDGVLPTSHHPTLRWWCDNLTSSRSLALTDFHIYLLTDYDELIDTGWESQPEWKRLDGILSSLKRSVNLKIQIMEDEPEIGNRAKSLKPLEQQFSRMGDLGRLEVGYMQAKEIFCHFGVHWVQEPFNS
ncbi:hypothetical protein E1B28_009585 [Marasmius oreades]|nr:uncharacterized protein E1B28_009585 [Marasmius oreades]KAG7090470.1 hypothetical protein E1B28_009585 [Marasmius oreades]